MTSIPLILTERHSCSYLENESASLAFLHPSVTLSAELYSQLLELGFRRSGNQVYRPHCPTCSDCIAVRIPVNSFKPARKHMRCRKKNRLTFAMIKPPAFHEYHYQLYQKYQLAKHGKGGMADSSPEDYMNFLSSIWCETWFVEFTINQQLVAVAIVDNLDNALSAVYTFYDPDFSSFSPGVFAILWQIKKAQELEKDWLYLGFWIEGCKKMQYKTEYHPIQGLVDDKWQYL